MSQYISVPNNVDDGLISELKQHWTDAQIIEIPYSWGALQGQITGSG